VSLADTLPRLRVCIVAKATPFIWVHHYVNAFRALCDVITIGSALSAQDLKETGRSHLAHLVRPNDIDREIRTIHELCDALPQGWKPDLIVSIQSGEPQIENIDWVACPTAHISIDTWHDFAEMLHALPYDFVFAAQREFAGYLTSSGCANAHWLPLACDREAHRPIERRKDYDIAFVGSIERSLHAQRIDRLDRLAHHFSILNDTALDADAMSEAYARGRLAFNSSVAQDLNMRVFETMAMGVPQLTNRDADVNGLLDLFRDGEHLIAYDDDDLVEKAAYYLADENARLQLGRRAREEVLARHTYAHRVQTLLETVSAKVDWNAVRARPLLRNHGAILDYLPITPGNTADFGMHAGISKYALRGRGVSQFTGIALKGSGNGHRKGSYDAILSDEDADATTPGFDTVLAASTKESAIAAEEIRKCHRLLRAGGTLVAGLSRGDLDRFNPSQQPGDAWASFQSLGFAVLRMELCEAKDEHAIRAFVVARKRDRNLKDIAREVFARNPIPGLSLEETLDRVP
jgi:hypothetical protein